MNRIAIQVEGLGKLLPHRLANQTNGRRTDVL